MSLGLFHSIFHEAGFKALERTLNNCANQNISIEELVNMANLIRKDNHFEFNVKVKQRISGTAIRKKFAPHSLCLHDHG